MLSSNPIGIFDSGIGGLTVVKEIMRQLPQEDIVYVGDNARCPYGNRTPEEVQQFAFEIMDFLVSQHVKMIIIACNTATAAALEAAKLRYDVPVLGVITPGSRAAITATRTGRVAVIGTEVTIKSGAYAREIHQINPRLQVVSVACPPFVKLVEESKNDTSEALETVRIYLEPIKKQMVDTLILGCTHYPLLTPVIEQVLGSHVNILSSADETAREASTLLAMKNLFHEGNLQPEYRFYTSGSTDMFTQIGADWLDRSIHVDSLKLGKIEDVIANG